MSIFVDETTKVVYQGLTGSQGRFYGLLNREYGTQVVAGTNPKKAGTDVDGIPVFATVADAVAATGATASCIFIPAPGVRDAVMEAAEAGIAFIVCITEGVPAHDEAWFFNKLRRDFPELAAARAQLSRHHQPRQGEHRDHRRPHRQGGRPGRHREPLRHAHLPGPLRAEAEGHRGHHLRGHRWRPGAGHQLHRLPARVRGRPRDQAVMMIGEIGGSAEEEAAAFIKAEMSKPVVSYVAGVTAPPGKKMGHAGAIVSGGKGTAAAKIEALRDAGAEVGLNPTEAGELMAKVVAGL